VLQVLDEGELIEPTLTLRGSDGSLRGQHGLPGSVTDIELAFYRDEYVLVGGAEAGQPGSLRANFVRRPDGRVAWFSSSGRPYARRA
jgi:hypothetical protein